MEPDKLHPQYKENCDAWQTCRDTASGQRAIHAGGTRYLPMLSGQTESTYTAYKKRALYFNATGRTVEAMTGLVFRKAPVIELPEALEAYRGDIDMAGRSIQGFARMSVEEVVTVGRGGVLVDYPPRANAESGAALTVEQARLRGLRPYLSFYKAEDVLNWRMSRIANTLRLSQVFLRELYEDAEGAEQEQIRELVLLPEYMQRVWRRADEKSEWSIYSQTTPVMNGKAIGEIPFFFFGPKESGCEVQNPPIEDLAHVNIAHYMNSADLENGAHVAGLPTPWVNGIDDPENFPALHLGADTFLKLPKDAQAGFLVCGSEGFATLEKAMDRKEQQMAALGARMLAPEKRQAEAAESHEIKRGGENSILAALAGSVERTLTKALAFMALWVGADESKVKVALNKDYIPVSMDANMLRELVGAYQGGTISFDTFFQNLQRGEIAPDNVTAEEELERIQTTAPALPMTDDNDQ
jgi:hypothetical protein